MQYLSEILRFLVTHSLQYLGVKLNHSSIVTILTKKNTITITIEVNFHIITLCFVLQVCTNFEGISQTKCLAKPLKGSSHDKLILSQHAASIYGFVRSVHFVCPINFSACCLVRFAAYFTVELN